MKKRLQKSKKPKDNQARNMKSKGPINTLAVRSGGPPMVLDLRQVLPQKGSTFVIPFHLQAANLLVQFLDQTFGPIH